MGVCLVMIAQVIQAGQCVAEERLLKNLQLPGTLIVGYEGVWGVLLMLTIVFPLLQVCCLGRVLRPLLQNQVRGFSFYFRYRASRFT